MKNWARIGSLSGVAFVGLVFASQLSSGGIPDSSTRPADVIAFYEAHQGGEQLGAVLTAMAVVIGLYFFSSLRNYLARVAGGAQFASLGFVGAIFFGVGGCVNAGVQWSLADAPSRLTPSAAQALNMLSKDNLATGFYIAGLAALMLFYGIAMVRTRLMPRWLGWLTIALGVIALAGPLAFLVFVATAPWAITVSILLYRRDRDAALAGPELDAP
jgi:hypothetical protein